VTGQALIARHRDYHLTTRHGYAVLNSTVGRTVPMATVRLLPAWLAPAYSSTPYRPRKSTASIADGASPPITPRLRRSA